MQKNINHNKNSEINNLNNINLAFNIYMIYYFNYGETEKKILDLQIKNEKLKENNDKLQKENNDLNERVTRLEKLILNSNKNNEPK